MINTASVVLAGHTCTFIYFWSIEKIDISWNTKELTNHLIETINISFHSVIMSNYHYSKDIYHCMPFCKNLNKVTCLASNTSVARMTQTCEHSQVINTGSMILTRQTQTFVNFYSRLKALLIFKRFIFKMVTFQKIVQIRFSVTCKNFVLSCSW